MMPARHSHHGYGWLDRVIFRLPRQEHGVISLHRRRIYVLPTRAGLAFGVALVVMLIASINYNLSLGYGMVFLLGAMGAISAIHAFRNLLRLEIKAGRTAAVFCGDTVQFAVNISNPEGRQRNGLHLRVRGHRGPSFSLDEQQNSAQFVSQHSTQRGILRMERLVIETFFPLGLIRAWSVLRLHNECIVYPAPESPAPPLPQRHDADRGQGEAAKAEDDFAGFLPYHPAYSPKHIAWKIAAREGPLLVKNFDGVGEGSLCLDWQDTPPMLGREKRLARLAAWVIAAHQRNLSFSLKLPGAQLDSTSGTLHRHAALKALALFNGRGTHG